MPVASLDAPFHPPALRPWSVRVRVGIRPRPESERRVREIFCTPLEGCFIPGLFLSDASGQPDAALFHDRSLLLERLRTQFRVDAAQREVRESVAVPPVDPLGVISQRRLPVVRQLLRQDMLDRKLFARRRIPALGSPPPSQS